MERESPPGTDHKELSLIRETGPSARLGICVKHKGGAWGKRTRPTQTNVRSLSDHYGPPLSQPTDRSLGGT